jgi:hypothetical protein
LLLELNINNIIYLFQDLGEARPGVLSDHSKTSEALGLRGILVVEWDDFGKALCGVGVHLHDRYDTLLWTRGDGSRRPNVKNIYLSLTKKKWMTLIRGWKRDLWKWDLAHNIKLFIWLSSENKKITWDSL